VLAQAAEGSGATASRAGAHGVSTRAVSSVPRPSSSEAYAKATSSSSALATLKVRSFSERRQTDSCANHAGAPTAMTLSCQVAWRPPPSAWMVLPVV
jgi:hypothetical protein